MTRTRLAFIVLVLNIVATLCAGQVVVLDTDFAYPLYDGDRQLSFRIDRKGKPAQAVTATVFYSTNAAKLSNLNDNSLPRGRAVLLTLGGDSMEARFVFPHKSHPIAPTADLYNQLHKNDVQGLVTDLVLDSRPDMNRFPSPYEVNPTIIEKEQCVYYRITLTGGYVTPTKSFCMPDTYNIVTAGDSYGAGEGAPQVTALDIAMGAHGSMWNTFPDDDCEDCHRSDNSGLVVGVRRFVEKYPEVAVDHLHVACSGAEAIHLYEWQDANGDSEFGNHVKPQLDRARDMMLTRHRRAHLLIMSAGGNSTDFGDFIMNYIINPFVALDANAVAAEIDMLMDELGVGYAHIEARLTDMAAETGGRFNPMVAICTYPDCTRGPGSDTCGLTDILDDADITVLYNPLSCDVVQPPQSDYDYARVHFLHPLNNRVRDSAQIHEWSIIEVDNADGTHGICNCEEPWFNTLGTTWSVQGDTRGAYHPNKDGYKEMYGDRVLQRITERHDTWRNNAAIYDALAVLSNAWYGREPGDEGYVEPYYTEGTCPTSERAGSRAAIQWVEVSNILHQNLDAWRARPVKGAVGELRVDPKVVELLGRAYGSADPKSALGRKEAVVVLDAARSVFEIQRRGQGAGALRNGNAVRNAAPVRSPEHTKLRDAARRWRESKEFKDLMDKIKTLATYGRQRDMSGTNTIREKTEKGPGQPQKRPGGG